MTTQVQQQDVHQLLAKQIRAMETAGRVGYSEQGNISSGCKELDASLPGGGYSPGTLVEWLDGESTLLKRPSGPEPMALATGSPRDAGYNRRTAPEASAYGSGAQQAEPMALATGSPRDAGHNRRASPEASAYGSGERLASGQRTLGSAGIGNGSFYLALNAARCAMQENNKYIVIVDTQESFYPPAAQFMGIPLERTIVLRPPTLEDSMWAIDQSLRSSAVAAVIARLDKLSELNARRFQLAAEQSGALGLFLRPTSARSQPSWSEVQWGVNSRSSTGGSSNVRRIYLQSLRMRGGRSGQHWVLMIDTRTGVITAEKVWEKSDAVSASSMHLATQLAVPANARPAIASKHTKRNRAS